MAGCSETVDYAAKRAEELKVEKYRRMTGTYHFIPIVFETFGAIGPAADKFFASFNFGTDFIVGNKISPFRRNKARKPSVFLALERKIAQLGMAATTWLCFEGKQSASLFGN